MRTKSILIVAILTVFHPAASGYAQQSPDERPQAERKQDNRYLVYMRGIT